MGCSFTQKSFCNTIHEDIPDNLIVRGYFSDQLSNGLVFTRIETLRGNEDRDEIKIWDNLPFDCNGEHLRLASYLGNIGEEVIISVTQIDTVYFEDETIGDYRVSEGLWWQTHSLKVLGDSVNGYILTNPLQEVNIETIHFDEFIVKVIDGAQCITTSTNNLRSDQFKIYPTLVNENIFISYDRVLEDSTVEIYNTSGQKMISNNLSPVFNLGTLSKGMYIIVIQASENRYFHTKIIKI
jgi:hypothetical protein